ncbi:MAG: lysozyme inhibitor LprI family protein [Roseibium aggregatum]
MSVRSVTLPALALFLATAGTAVAEEEKVNDNIDCGYPLTEAERSFCADKALEDADTRMNEAFDRLRARLVEIDAELPEELKGAPASLDDAQAAWNTYADKDCTAYSFPFRGGTRGNELYRNCLIVLTMKRTEDLDATVEDYAN